MKERSSTREIRRECALEIRPCKFLPRHVTCVLSHKKCWWIDRQQRSPREFQISHRDVHTFFFFFSFSFLTSFFFCSHRLWQFEKNTIFPWSERLLFLSIPVYISFYFLFLFFFFFFFFQKWNIVEDAFGLLHPFRSCWSCRFCASFKHTGRFEGGFIEKKGTWRWILFNRGPATPRWLTFTFVSSKLSICLPVPAVSCQATMRCLIK